MFDLCLFAFLFLLLFIFRCCLYIVSAWNNVVDCILIVDIGHLCFIDICCCLDFVNEWMRGQYAGLLIIFFFAFACWIIAWNLLGCACCHYLYHPWTLRKMSNLGLGVHLRNTMMLGFQNCVPNVSKFFVILPYLSMLCLWRLFFTCCSEELCIFASVWFRLTPCHLGCHWTKCVNLFLLMLSELSNLLEG